MMYRYIPVPLSTDETGRYARYCVGTYSIISEYLWYLYAEIGIHYLPYLFLMAPGSLSLAGHELHKATNR